MYLGVGMAALGAFIIFDANGNKCGILLGALVQVVGYVLLWRGSSIRHIGKTPKTPKTPDKPDDDQGRRASFTNF